jgi:CheY-like chemotaxis protein
LPASLALANAFVNKIVSPHRVRTLVLSAQLFSAPLQHLVDCVSLLSTLTLFLIHSWSMGTGVEQVKTIPKKHGKTVLLVDDNPAIRHELESLFLSDGFAIAGEACNGKEAVDLARKIAPDLIILDLSMPVMNGLEAAPQLKVVAPKSVIILLTMYAAEAVSQQAASSGIDMVLSKTESTDKILAKAHSLLHMGNT